MPRREKEEPYEKSTSSASEGGCWIGQRRVRTWNAPLSSLSLSLSLTVYHRL